MRVVIQKVKSARVEVDNEIKGLIEKGLLLFVAVEDADSQEDISYLVHKIPRLRIFPDAQGKMNRSLIDEEDARILLISQFTLFADIRKGQRPSFIRSGKPEFARMMIEILARRLEAETHTRVETGVFGANMQVHLINDGPVTLIVDTKTKDL